MNMKKVYGLLLSVAIAGNVLPTALAAESISVSINGTTVDFSKYDNVLPYIESDTVLVPVRAVAESLGLSVKWNGETQTVQIEGPNEITLTINSDTAIINGESITLDVPVQMVEDRILVPLSFISENLGADVEWNEQEKNILIETNDEKHDVSGGGHGNMENVQTEISQDILAVINEGSEKFSQFTYVDEESGTELEYSLYVPEDYDENEQYPMLMYIPDSTGAGKSAKEIVEQYYGADIWVTDEEQAKHESFVLVPAFSETVVDDAWNTSEEIETAVKLINDLTEEYSIDTDRLYITGQSMGCMTSLYLNSKYPDLFAASLFVSGQWDISVLEPLENEKFFYIVAGGDVKASSGQEQVKEMFDADGVKYSYGTWNAQNSEEEQNAAVQALIAEGYDANMICFEAGSVLNGGSGMEHMASFNYAYKIAAVRDWIFEQSNNR